MDELLFSKKFYVRKLQKNGVGSAIVNELIDYLTIHKYKEVRLGWINGNLQAEHFWIKNGFIL